jgi:phosphate binding protein
MKKRFLFGMLAITMTVSACGSPTTKVAPSTAASPFDPAATKGNIVTAGSSTVFPITQRMADLFRREGYTGNITVDNIGTGAGFERFCKSGETDISNASRPIKDSEKENCRKIGRAPLEFQIAIDALAVVVSRENNFVKNLSQAQLADIFSGKVGKWSEVDANYPTEAIKLFSPGTDSGTFDYFVEAILNNKKDGILSVKGIQLSENDNVLAKGIEGSKYAIGYFGFAYYLADRGKLRAVAIEGVEPSKETVENKKYALARPLFLYSDAAIMKNKPQVAAFIRFCLDAPDKEIVKAGYFPPTAEMKKKANELFDQVMEVAQ